MYPGIDELHSFVVLAGELHFGRASKRLFVSQPALSKKIRKLEEKVGAELISRFVATMRAVVRSEKVSAISR
jgi:DNA-binding transcriptional LysR family regulator